MRLILETWRYISFFAHMQGDIELDYIHLPSVRITRLRTHSPRTFVQYRCRPFHSLSQLEGVTGLVELHLVKKKAKTQHFICIIIILTDNKTATCRIIATTAFCPNPFDTLAGMFWTAILTHWGCVTHICIGNLTIIGPDNSLSPGRRQAIIWTNAGILLIGPWRTNFCEI